MSMQPRYPIYIPSKGRWKTPYTIQALQRMGVSFRVVVEPQEYDHYATVVDKTDLLVTPHHDEGLVVTRNWIWDHAEQSGCRRFWTFDDNIRDVYRLNHNMKVRVKAPGPLCAIENWVDRYENVIIAGMQYELFVERKRKYPPLRFNTRVYSNMLILTNACDPFGHPYRNRGFYNDDTDLCLRVLKDGWCTVLFHAFLADKIATMHVAGGMTPHYQDDGRLKMAQSLKRQHPDVVKITRKWGRWQHQVDYRPFRGNRLIKRKDSKIADEPNEYGMALESTGLKR